MANDIGTGTTITHGTTSYAIEILSVSGDVSRAVIDVTHMGTSGGRDKKPGDLYDAGSIRVSAHLNPDEEAPYSSAAETVTVTFPIPSGLTNGATVAGTGFVSNFSWTSPLEDKMTCEYTVTWSGDIAWVNAS